MGYRPQRLLPVWLVMELRTYPRRLRAHELAVEVSVRAARLTRSLSGPGAADRADQLVRAALSVSSNIAEACGRSSVADFRQFLLRARGSAQETLTQLRVAAALDPGHAHAIQALESRVALVQKMLGRLIAHPPSER